MTAYLFDLFPKPFKSRISNWEWKWHPDGKFVWGIMVDNLSNRKFIKVLRETWRPDGTVEIEDEKYRYILLSNARTRKGPEYINKRPLNEAII